MKLMQMIKADVLFGDDVDHEAVALDEADEAEVTDEAEACDEANAVSYWNWCSSVAEAAFAVCRCDEADVAPATGLLQLLRVAMMIMVMIKTPATVEVHTFFSDFPGFRSLRTLPKNFGEKWNCYRMKKTQGLGIQQKSRKNIRRFWVKEPRHSETFSHEKCYL